MTRGKGAAALLFLVLAVTGALLRVVYDA